MEGIEYINSQIINKSMDFLKALSTIEGCLIFPILSENHAKDLCQNKQVIDCFKESIYFPLHFSFFHAYPTNWTQCTY